MIYRNGGTTAMARLTKPAEAIPWRGRSLPRPDKSGLAMTFREGLRMTGKTVLEFMCLTI
jgi:hypothetical protein